MEPLATRQHILSLDSRKIKAGHKMPGHKRPTENIRRQKWVQSEEDIHKSRMLNSLPVRIDVTMEIWKIDVTRMQHCLPSTIWSIFYLFIFFKCSVSDVIKCYKLSDCIVLCANRHSAVPIWYKPFSLAQGCVTAASQQLQFGWDFPLWGVWREKCTVQQPDTVFRRWALPQFCVRALERTAGLK